MKATLAAEEQPHERRGRVSASPVAFVILVVLFEMLRRHRLREKYAVLWFFVAVGVARGRALPGAARPRLADLVGVEVPANLLFFLGQHGAPDADRLQHSYELGRLEEKTRTLAEEIALLRLELDTRSDPEPGETSG